MKNSQPQSKPENNYLFGDSEPAARRLKLLARIFESSTRAFLRKAADYRAWRLALDLGCGPGSTTRLIAQTLGCEQVCGLDSSESFLALARNAGSRQLLFIKHDITAVPFSCGRPDLIFCRFLLTHLPDPVANIRRWSVQLNPEGLMLLEEVEAIRTTHPVFAAYLDMVDRLLASQSNRLYAGPLLYRSSLPENVHPVINEIRSVTVKNCDAAAMFALNMRAWKESEFIRRNYPTAAAVELERALTELAQEQAPTCDVMWEMRQAALKNSQPPAAPPC